ncbi:ATP-binding protein [candidate division KSB1 bacterium]|nr:ATP-binding protein [candidate division KSB1 bacterium]
MAKSIRKYFSLGLVLILILGLSGGLIGLNYLDLKILQNIIWLPLIKYFLLILGFPLAILVTKVALLKRSWDYIFLNLGLWSYLVFLVFPKIHYWLMLQTNQTIDDQIALLFWGIGSTIFVFALWLSAWFDSRPIEAKHYPQAVILGYILGILVILMGALVALFFAESLFGNQLYLSRAFLGIGAFQILATLLSGARYLKYYWRREIRTYFWFLLVAVFLGFGSLLMLFMLLTRIEFYELIYGLHFLTLFSLMMVFFNEQHHFLETETTLRSSLERSLQETEMRLKNYLALINEILVGIFVLDPEGKVIFCNNQFCEIVGQEQSKLFGNSYLAFIDRTDEEKFQMEQQKWRENVTSQIEIELVHKSKQRLPVMLLSSPIIERTRKYLGSRHVAVPIQHWKEVEQDLIDRSENLEKIIQQRTSALKKKSTELEYAKNYYETLISGMLDIMLVMDNQGKCTFMNKFAQQLLGFNAEELSSKNLPEFFTDFKRLQRDYGSAVNIELHDHEHEIRAKSGQTILCSWNVHLLPELDNQPMGVMFVGRNITEYKKLQEQLQDQTRNLELLAERRTGELNRKVNQLNKIIQIGEDIVLNLDLNVILKNICEAIKTLGWNIVMITLRDFETNAIQIVAATGLNEKKFRELSEKRRFDFKEMLTFMREEIRISHSYFIEHSAGIFDFEKTRLPRLTRLFSKNSQWQEGDSLLVPIKIKTKILGFIIVQNPHDRQQPDKDQAQALEIFANKAAVVIENARYYHDAKHQAGEMEKVSRLKSEFLAKMSHELRTPLNSIITLTNILLKGLPGRLNDEQIKQVKIIEKNSQNLLRLINGLLDLSKIEAGKMEIHYTCFALEEFIQNQAETIRPLCAEKGLKLEVHIDKKLPKFIFSDQDKIGQILTNLLSNAVKFTEKGKIALSLHSSHSASRLQIMIEDTGIGMDKTDLARIFQEFTQLDSQKALQVKGGTGLGLSISKKIVELLEGTIEVSSKTNQGTTFTILLPLKAVSTEDLPAQVTDSSGKIKLSLAENQDGETLVLEPDEPALGAPVAAVAPLIEPEPTSPVKSSVRKPRKSRSSQSQAHILLVDDNEDNRYAMSYFLKEKGYQISFATDGQSGVESAVKIKPNLILMDVMMPGMDGYEATRILKSKPEFRNIPIIAMTAKAMSYDREKALAAGYDDYIAKPFSLEQVHEKIDRWIKTTSS